MKNPIGNANTTIITPYFDGICRPPPARSVLPEVKDKPILKVYSTILLKHDIV